MTGECGIEDGIVHCEAKAWDVRENRCDGKEKYVETGERTECGGLTNVVGGVGGGWGMER